MSNWIYNPIRLEILRDGRKRIACAVDRYKSIVLTEYDANGDVCFVNTVYPRNMPKGNVDLAATRLFGQVYINLLSELGINYDPARVPIIKFENAVN